MYLLDHLRQTARTGQVDHHVQDLLVAIAPASHLEPAAALRHDVLYRKSILQREFNLACM